MPIPLQVKGALVLHELASCPEHRVVPNSFWRTQASRHGSRLCPQLRNKLVLAPRVGFAAFARTQCPAKLRLRRTDDGNIPMASSGCLGRSFPIPIDVSRTNPVLTTVWSHLCAPETCTCTSPAYIRHKSPQSVPADDLWVCSRHLSSTMASQTQPLFCCSSIWFTGTARCSTRWRMLSASATESSSLPSLCR